MTSQLEPITGHVGDYFAQFTMGLGYSLKNIVSFEEGAELGKFAAQLSLSRYWHIERRNNFGHFIMQLSRKICQDKILRNNFDWDEPNGEVSLCLGSCYIM